MKKLFYPLPYLLVAFILIANQPTNAVAETSYVQPSLLEETALKNVGIEPQFMYIPDLDLFTVVESVGLTTQSTMDTPANWQNSAWYKYGFKPGENGHAVLAAHRDWAGNTGPFWDLKKLKVGSRIVVIGKNGRTIIFSVDANTQYYRNEDVGLKVFGPSNTPRMSLITCDGNFLTQEETYDQRRVVAARLIYDSIQN